jgi:hypothetical protein
MGPACVNWCCSLSLERKTKTKARYMGRVDMAYRHLLYYGWDANGIMFFTPAQVSEGHVIIAPNELSCRERLDTTLSGLLCSALLCSAHYSCNVLLFHSGLFCPLFHVCIF